MKRKKYWTETVVWETWDLPPIKSDVKPSNYTESDILKKGDTLALKPRGDVTRSPKQAPQKAGADPGFP